jgi:hypothetical protein
MEEEEEASFLGGQWKKKDKHPCLGVNGKKRRNIIFTS